jgi:hypothetical protein
MSPSALKIHPKCNPSDSEVYYFTNVVEIYALGAFTTLFLIFGGCPLSSMSLAGSSLHVCEKVANLSFLECEFRSTLVISFASVHGL